MIDKISLDFYLHKTTKKKCKIIIIEKSLKIETFSGGRCCLDRSERKLVPFIDQSILTGNSQVNSGRWPVIK